MKIERLNERQIRCTLTHEDLARHGVRLSEFAYGTKKARALFQDMMEQASREVGFESDDYPLMIEAVPVNAECLVLIVTLVDDPEELDTRFSSFGPAMDEEDEEDEGEYSLDERDAESPEENSFYRLLRGMQEGDYSSLSDQFTAHLTPAGVQQLTGRQQTKKPHKKDRDQKPRIFTFDALHEVQNAAVRLDDRTSCAKSTLYRDEKRRFYLCLKPLAGEDNSKGFLPLCALLAEYGAAVASSGINEEYLQEHCEVLIRNNALSQLALL